MKILFEIPAYLIQAHLKLEDVWPYIVWKMPIYHFDC